MSAQPTKITPKKIFIASDHAGVKLKADLIQSLPELPWEDLGPHTEESVDYPDYADQLAVKIQDDTTVGVLICGSGQGMAIRANRYPHIRAALCWNEEVVTLTRQHNNSNVLCLGSKWQSAADAKKMLEKFLNTEFEGGRHARRVEKLWKLSE